MLKHVETVKEERGPWGKVRMDLMVGAFGNYTHQLTILNPQGVGHVRTCWGGHDIAVKTLSRIVRDLKQGGSGRWV